MKLLNLNLTLNLLLIATCKTMVLGKNFGVLLSKLRQITFSSDFFVFLPSVSFDSLNALKFLGAEVYHMANCARHIFRWVLVLMSISCELMTSLCIFRPCLQSPSHQDPLLEPCTKILIFASEIQWRQTCTWYSNLSNEGKAWFCTMLHIH